MRREATCTRRGGLEENLRRRAEWLYDIEIGRRLPREHQHLGDLDQRIRAMFPMFWRTKKGRGRWQKTWCGKTAKELCDASTNPMRKFQYETIYGHASAIVHGGPSSTATTFTYYDEQEHEDDVIERIQRLEEHRLRMVATRASGFLFEVLVLVGDRLPDYDAAWVLSMSPRLVGLMQKP